MPISFPYPTIGGEKRPTGQGCITCVHQAYCQAWYWFRVFQPIGGLRLSGNIGTQCLQWSDDEVDRITEVTQDDLDENDRLNTEFGGILREPDTGGIVEPTTGSRRRQNF